ncbi:hypothetical protein DBA29_06365 [Xenophilus aerolatus]|nr:hypothetical protein [Xenophilus aerolatus]
MKLDREGAPHEQPLAPQDWSMEILHEEDQHIAVVCRRGVPMCRVSMSRHGEAAEKVRTALAERARAWIAEYLQRENSSAP